MTASCAEVPEGRLPAVAGERECFGGAAELCSWITGADSIVYGSVTSLEPITDPVYFADRDDGGTGQVYGTASECTGSMTYGLRIGLNVLRARGNPVPRLLDVSIGYLETEWWLPFPTMEDGSIAWAGSGDPIELGQGLGVALMSTEAGLLSPLEEPLFVVADGRLEFQTVACLAPPEGDLTLDDVMQATCDGDEGIDRRTYKLNHDSLGYTGSSYCCCETPPDDAECRHNIDCEAGSTCVDEVCVAAQ